MDIHIMLWLGLMFSFVLVIIGLNAIKTRDDK